MFWHFDSKSHIPWNQILRKARVVNWIFALKLFWSLKMIDEADILQAYYSQLIEPTKWMIAWQRSSSCDLNKSNGI